eukprot:357752-Chlamydomonas_euryale.AAC.6
MTMCPKCSNMQRLVPAGETHTPSLAPPPPFPPTLPHTRAARPAGLCEAAHSHKEAACAWPRVRD